VARPADCCLLLVSLSARVTLCRTQSVRANASLWLAVKSRRKTGRNTGRNHSLRTTVLGSSPLPPANLASSKAPRPRPHADHCHFEPIRVHWSPFWSPLDGRKRSSAGHHSFLSTVRVWPLAWRRTLAADLRCRPKVRLPSPQSDQRRHKCSGKFTVANGEPQLQVASHTRRPNCERKPGAELG